MGMADSNIPLLAIVGPTAVGKTALAVGLAAHLPVEAIGADSRQVYRGLDIGSAKPTAEERAAVPYHLLDVVDPDETLDVATYQRLATATITEVWARGRLPILVGGSGQYVWAVLEGWRIPEVPPDPALRAALTARAEALGPEALHAELAAHDPAAAARIDARNVRRVVRALEVCRATGQRCSDLPRREPPPYMIATVGLTWDRARLYRRIDRRVEAMVAEGFVQEVAGLLARGYGPELPALSGFGYREITAYLRGAIDLPAAIEATKTGTHRLARTQANWFRSTDPRITWFDADQDPLAGVRPLAERLLAGEALGATG